MYSIRYGLVTAYTIAVVLFWDIFLKVITDGFEIKIIGDFFKFNSVHNYGAAYGIFSDHTFILTIVSALMIVVLLIYNWFKKNKSIFYCISMGLILGGAIGNLIDRVFLGYVRDFIKFSFFSPTFNLADACLCVGVVCFVIYLIFYDDTFKRKHPKQKKTTVDNSSLDKKSEMGVKKIHTQKQDVYVVDDDD